MITSFKNQTKQKEDRTVNRNKQHMELADRLLTLATEIDIAKSPYTPHRVGYVSDEVCHKLRFLIQTSSVDEWKFWFGFQKQMNTIWNSMRCANPDMVSLTLKLLAAEIRRS